MADTFQILLETIAKGNGAAQTVAGIKAVDAAQAHLNQTTAQAAPAINQAAGSTRNMGGALLQGSRALQDMQYGLAGAVNNLEGIASALGLGAGVAGAVTVLAVAVQTLGPHVVEWFKSLDSEGKKLDELKEKLRAGAELILGEWTPASQAAKDEADKFTDSLKNQAAAFDTLDKAQQASLDVLKKRQSVEAEIAKTKEENDIADIKAKNLPKDEEARAIAAVKLEKAKADRARELQGMQGEQTIAGEAVSNATQEAAMAEEKRQKLEREKRIAIRSATIDLEISGTKDKDGNPLQKGALDRIKDAEANVRGAESLRGMPGIDQGFVKEQMIKAQDELARERKRLADLQAEQKRNVELNGGNTQFRPVEKIDSDINQATTAAEVAKKKQAAAELDKNKLDAIQFEQKRKIENDYSQAQGKAIAGLPDEGAARATREHVHDQSDPFAAAAQKRAMMPRRDLIAEENGTAPRPPNERRNLVAEEMMNAPTSSNKAAEIKRQLDEANAALAAMGLGIATLANTAKKTAEQVKNSR